MGGNVPVGLAAAGDYTVTAGVVLVPQACQWHFTQVM